jgi:hypothetical protein
MGHHRHTRKEGRLYRQQNSLETRRGCPGTPFRDPAANQNPLQISLSRDPWSLVGHPLVICMDTGTRNTTPNDPLSEPYSMTSRDTCRSGSVRKESLNKGNGNGNGERGSW